MLSNASIIVLGVKHKLINTLYIMKATKIMLAVIATLIITWLTLGLIFYVTTDLTYKESISNAAIGWLMLFIGWVPAIVVAADLDEQL